MRGLLPVIAVAAGIGVILLLTSGNGASVDGDAIARMVYLGILGTVVAAGILGSGMRFRTVARQLAMWAVVIMALVAGYQYRYELQDFASRVTAGLIPGSPLSVAGEGGRVAVMIEKAANGHFQTTVSINGVAIPAMLDTGATTTVLTSAAAERVGFKREQLSFTVPISTANGPSRAARVMTDEISIGGITRRRVPVMVAEPGKLEISLLGMNFVGTLSGVDIRGDRLILRD